MTAPLGLAWPPAIPGRMARAVPVVLAAAVVAAQVVYPLIDGAARDALTVATVCVFFAVSATHAAAWRGARFAAGLVAITAGGGLAVEVAGVTTGWPFGAYAYADSLGWALAGVPVIIPLAWTMMAYPAWLVAGRITAHALWRAVVAGWALASWDLFLDPQMVAEGHWTWAAAEPALLDVPLTNFAGWFATATVMMALLSRLSARGVVHAHGGTARSGAVRGFAVFSGAADDRPMYGLYLWVYASSVLAHAAFFGLPGSALAGGAGMGAVVAAFAWAVRRR